MIRSPHLLIEAANKAGIHTPEDPHDFEPCEYPHFAVYANAQLHKLMPHEEAHHANARLVANISSDKVLHVSLRELVDLGFQIGKGK